MPQFNDEKPKKNQIRKFEIEKKLETPAHKLKPRNKNSEKGAKQLKIEHEFFTHQEK